MNEALHHSLHSNVPHICNGSWPWEPGRSPLRISGASQKMRILSFLYIMSSLSRSVSVPQFDGERGKLRVCRTQTILFALCIQWRTLHSRVQKDLSLFFCAMGVLSCWSDRTCAPHMGISHHCVYFCNCLLPGGYGSIMTHRTLPQLNHKCFWQRQPRTIQHGCCEFFNMR